MVRQADGTTFSHEYSIKDHLGNTRVTYSDANNDGVITVADIKQINHYYPFGMNMEGSWNGAAGSNKYQYNGKEWNDDFGLGLNDYGARFYDAAIGRWGAVDPMAEKFLSHNPYNYVKNRPTIMVDPNGMEAVFDAQTGELEHATGKDAQNAFRGLRKTLSRQQNGLRNAKLTVSSAESANKGYIREATQKDGLTGNIYEVPIYKATLTGTDADGNNQSYDFYVARVGVKNGKKTSLKAGTYNIGEWNQKAIDGLGGWPIDGAPRYYLHEGSPYVMTRYTKGGYMANYGCIAFCFASENGKWVGPDAFDNFADKVLSLTGSGSREEVGGHLTVEIEEFTTEPAVKKVGTFIGILATKPNGDRTVKYTNSFDK